MHSDKEGQEERRWMRRRRKPSDEGPLLRPPMRAITLNSSSYKAYWEEKAFAEHSELGLLGGYTWPPRSYPCSFCRREFRSAQALGGHMNVHRRDRARLKLSSSSIGDNQDTTVEIDLYPNAPQATLKRSSKPNPNTLCGDNIASPLSSHNRRDLVASAATEIWSEHIFIYPPYSLPNVRHNKKDTTLSFTVQCSGEDPKTIDPPRSIQELAYGRDNLGCQPRRSYRDEDSEETINSKRSKTNHTTSPLLARSFAGKGQQFPPEVLKLCSNSLEELDLELRLGDPPKI